MPAGWDLLAVTRMNGIMQTLRDVRDLPATLRFLNRTAQVNATDGEIMGRFDGDVLAADLIADDQAAVVRATGKFTFERNKIPNLKHGTLITQDMLNLLDRINQGGGIPADLGILGDYKNRIMDGLLLGVRQRMNALIAAMWIDALNYDRLGVKIQNATWGMPAALKVTPATPWTDTSATPITTIQTLAGETAAETYGEAYNRITMSSRAFRRMIATTEFTAKAQLYAQQTFPAGSFPGNDTQMLRILAGRILGMEIELEDTRYKTESPAGVLVSAPYLPANKVVLSNSADDNDPNVMRWGNGVVTETVVSSLADVGMIGKFAGPEYGPVGYTTATHNPPQVTVWGVGRGFPMKERLSSTAVITIAADGVTL